MISLHSAVSRGFFWQYGSSVTFCFSPGTTISYDGTLRSTVVFKCCTSRLTTYGARILFSTTSEFHFAFLVNSVSLSWCLSIWLTSFAPQNLNDESTRLNILQVHAWNWLNVAEYLAQLFLHPVHIPRVAQQKATELNLAGIPWNIDKEPWISGSIFSPEKRVNINFLSFYILPYTCFSRSLHNLHSLDRLTAISRCYEDQKQNANFVVCAILNDKKAQVETLATNWRHFPFFRVSPQPTFSGSRQQCRPCIASSDFRFQALRLAL